MNAQSKLNTGSILMFLASIAFIGYAVVFFFMNFSSQFLELGITREQVDVGRDEILQFSPSLFQYISHLHVAVSGFIAATGLAVAGLSWYGVRKGELWAWVIAVATPVLGLAIALPLHYPNGFDTFMHLGPIYLATGIFVIGALLALIGLLKSKRTT